MVVHEVHRLYEVAVQRDIIRVVPRKLVEAVEMVRIGDLVVVQRTRRSVDYIVEAKISARGEIRGQNAVVASVHKDRRNAREFAGRKDLFDAFVDAIRLRLLQTGKGRSFDSIFTGRERTQAERAVGVLVWGRAAILFWSACRGVVDEGYAGSRRDTVAGAEDDRLARRRERHRPSARYATVSRQAVSAQVIEHAEAAVSVGVSDRNRLRDIGEPVAGLDQVLFREDAEVIDNLLRLGSLVGERRRGE